MSHDNFDGGSKQFELLSEQFSSLINLLESISGQVQFPELAEAASSVALDVDKYCEQTGGFSTSEFENNVLDLSRFTKAEYIETLEQANRHVIAAFQDGDFEFGCRSWGLKQEIAKMLNTAMS